MGEMTDDLLAEEEHLVHQRMSQHCLVEFADSDLLNHLGSRTARGDLITVELGDVQEHAAMGVIKPIGSERPRRTLPVYVPTFSVHYSDNIAVKVLHQFRHPTKSLDKCDCGEIAFSMLERIR